MTLTLRVIANISIRNWIAPMVLSAPRPTLYAGRAANCLPSREEVSTVTNRSFKSANAFALREWPFATFLALLLGIGQAMFAWQNGKVELADVKYTQIDGVGPLKPVKIFLNGSNTASTNAVFAVVAKKRVGARIICVDVELGSRIGPGRMISKMSRTNSCSTVGADGAIRIPAPQDPDSVVAIYLEIPDDTKLDFSVNNERVLLGQIMNSFAWKNGRTLDAKISGPASTLLLAQGFDLSPQTAKIVETKGVYFANSEALKEHVIHPQQFRYKLLQRGEGQLPMVSVPIAIDANGFAVNVKPIGNPGELQPVIEQYIKALRFRPFSVGGQAVAVRASLNFRVDAEGSVWGPVNLISFEPIGVERGGVSTCCQK